MGVRVARGAEEQPHDLGDVVLMDTELVQAPHVPVFQGLRLLGAEPELATESCEIGPPALAQARVLAHVEDHLVEGQSLVAALHVTHASTPWDSPSGT